MSEITIDSEKIAEVKTAITIIKLAAENSFCYSVLTESDLIIIKEQVKRIDKLLPDVKFEGGK